MRTAQPGRRCSNCMPASPTHAEPSPRQTAQGPNPLDDAGSNRVADAAAQARGTPGPGSGPHTHHPEMCVSGVGRATTVGLFPPQRCEDDQEPQGKRPDRQGSLQTYLPRNIEYEANTRTLPEGQHYPPGQSQTPSTVHCTYLASSSGEQTRSSPCPSQLSATSAIHGDQHLNC